MNTEEKKEEVTPHKWYHGVGFIVLMLFCIGPLGLPLLFSSPRFSRPSKILITILVIGITVYITVEMIRVVHMAFDYYQNMFGLVF